MPSTLYCIELLGLQGHLVEIEVDKLGGIPAFIIVGLPDAAVKEAVERVKSALKNTAVAFPRNKIIVNLAPADLRKSGTRYDLPIALGILAIEDIIPPTPRDTMAIGELALNGKLRPVTGVLASVEAAREKGFKKLIVPRQNAREAMLIRGVEVVPADDLTEVIAYLQDRLCLLPVRESGLPPEPACEVDMQTIRGQKRARRALEIAAAGGHNLLFYGPPGAGKTLMARAMAGILPFMSEAEMLEVTKLYSIAGLLPASQPLITRRPFRAIHHTASAVSIVGGGAIPTPGEISLAHRGVLFLDEIAEFQQYALEVLRQPIENRFVTISRARGSFVFPAEFTLITAMNPCPCGYFGTEPKDRCKCTAAQVRRYQKRLSGPLLDRIDMHLSVKPLPHEHLLDETPEEASSAVRGRVERAAHMQRDRLKKYGLCKNSEMKNEHIQKLCPVNAVSRQLLQTAIRQMSLSARGYFRVIRLARTIADLDQQENIQPGHIAEAIQFRSLVFDG